MDKTRERLQDLCIFLIVFSLLLSIVFLASGSWALIRELGLIKSMQTWYYTDFTWPYLLRPFLYSVAFAYLAYVFFSLRNEPSPFIRKTATHLKVLSIVFLIALSLPHLMVRGIVFATGMHMTTEGFTMSQVIFPVVIAVAIFGLALIFQYGVMLQNDTDEIV